MMMNNHPLLQVDGYDGDDVPSPFSGGWRCEDKATLRGMECHDTFNK